MNGYDAVATLHDDTLGTDEVPMEQVPPKSAGEAARAPDLSGLKQCGGVWLPAPETHMVEWMTERNEPVDGHLTYQYHKYARVLDWFAEHGRKRRVAVDLGAHCGTWAMHMVKDFQYVHAFEPVPLHRRAFEANMAEVGADNWRLYPWAAMDRVGTVRMSLEGRSSSGGMHVRKGGGTAVEARPLDALMLTAVDFIKIDVEGQELPAVLGAEETIRRTCPVICVEQKGWNADHVRDGNSDAAKQIIEWGAGVVEVISGDWILAWT